MIDANTKETIASNYAIKASEYDKIRLGNPRGALLSQLDIRLVNSMLQVPADTTLLEIGAGTGRFTLPILERGYKIVATDINASLLEGLRAKVADAGVAKRCTIQTENVFELSFEDNSFDYVYSFHVLPRFLTLEDQATAIKEVGRVIKPGGYFLFNYRNSRSPYNLLYRGPAASPVEIKRALTDAELHIVNTRGKHISNRKLYNIMPMVANRAFSAVDRCLQKVLPSFAWDVFVLAKKQLTRT